MTSVFYYIDESGTLKANECEKERFFILGCCITDTPEDIRKSLNELKLEIEDDAYFCSEINKFKQDGFHATTNHPDIRAKYYGRLNSLNFRAFSIIIDKCSTQFNELSGKHRAYYEILHMLLYKRILSNREYRNVIVLEEYGSKLNVHLENIQKTIESIKEKILKLYDIDVIVEVYVHNKSDIVLSVVDYMNFVLYQMLLPTIKHQQPRMPENFSLIEPKIGLLHSFFQNKFFTERNRINFEHIKSGVK